MTEKVHAEKAGDKPAKKRARSSNKAKDNSAISLVLGLAMAGIFVVVVYSVMQRSARGDYEYWNEYQRVAPELWQADRAKPDDLWYKVQALPREKITDSTVLKLHEAWVEYATAIRNPATFSKREAELEGRIRYLEDEVHRVLSAGAKRR